MLKTSAAPSRACGSLGAPVALLIVLVAVSAGCGGNLPGSQPPRLVVLYAPCTVSKTFLSPYAEDVAFTPHLADFAAQSVTFDAHRTEAGSSGIAYASIFTGSQADRHGVVQHPAALRIEAYLIAEAFAEQGYETWYWNGQRMASLRLGYGQGVPPEHAFRRGLRGGDPRFDALLAGLAADPTRRAFVMTNFSATHGPYSSKAVEKFLERFPEEAPSVEESDRARLIGLYQRNTLALEYNFQPTLERIGVGPHEVRALADSVELAYKSNIWRLDALFGEVIAAIDGRGLRDESLVVFTADHGEVLYRDQELFKFTHSSSLAPEVIDVPLLVRSPRLRPGRYEGVTRSIDVFPTMLGLSGSTSPDGRGIDGVDLTDVLVSGADALDLSAYSHTSVIPEAVERRMQAPGGAETWGLRMRLYPRADIRFSEVTLRRGLRVFRHRNSGDGRFEDVAFDRSNDPFETVDVFDPDDPRDRAAASELLQYKARLVASTQAKRDSPAAGSPGRDEAEEALRALGYIQ
jgi:arylsulfatase A-like enzyme